LQNSEDTRKFSEWILRVGNGEIGKGNDGYYDMEIPPELLITDFTDPIAAIVQATYPNLLQNFQDGEFLRNRAILASTIQVVDDINNYVLNLLPCNILIDIIFQK
jgi:ATP-dependent DNA helicase PIF1